MNKTTTAVALAVAAACGYVAVQRHDPSPSPVATAAVTTPGQSAAADTAAKPVGTLPAPFQASNGGTTPGDNVRRYMALGTPASAFDAFELIDQCVRHERHDTGEQTARCAGITSDMRRKAGELLAIAVDANVAGAPAEFVRTLMSLTDQELAKARRENPRFDEAARFVVAKLHENAPRDREAIRVLSHLYAQTNAITGRRDPEKALMYYTAFTELVVAPGQERVKQIVIDSLLADLTPEQAQRARDAGLRLARNCDCRG